MCDGGEIECSCLALNSSQLSQNNFQNQKSPLNFSCFRTFLSNPKSLFFSFIVNVFFITSSHTFFYRSQLSQNNFKNQIVWEVFVGDVLVVGEVIG